VAGGEESFEVGLASHGSLGLLDISPEAVPVTPGESLWKDFIVPEGLSRDRQARRSAFPLGASCPWVTLELRHVNWLIAMCLLKITKSLLL
jgi:hypothetical protein